MIFEKIRDLICTQFINVERASITRETSFVDDLDADSLDVVELTMALEEEFSLPEIPEEELKSIVTVGDLAEYVGRFVQD
ncbi:MAG: acyl carrier protein [Oscillospiraceae bacterium]|nr:acyl carrier protein [Oscillospiraceae bacterium]